MSTLNNYQEYMSSAHQRFVEYQKLLEKKEKEDLFMFYHCSRDFIIIIRKYLKPSLVNYKDYDYYYDARQDCPNDDTLYDYQEDYDEACRLYSKIDDMAIRNQDSYDYEYAVLDYLEFIIEMDRRQKIYGR